MTTSAITKARAALNRVPAVPDSAILLLNNDGPNYTLGDFRQLVREAEEMAAQEMPSDLCDLKAQ
jgi:hypothetical protein